MTAARKQLKHHTFMHVAEAIATLGTCNRKYVGAVIIRSGRCVSWGFNGAPPGFPHCEDNNHGWQEMEEIGIAIIHDSVVSYPDGSVEDFYCRNATHAEANALAYAARQGISTDKAELYVTVSPCDVCSRLIVAAGITRVFYKETYRDTSGLFLLRAAGIECTPTT